MFRRTAAALSVGLLIVAGCRPHLGPIATPTPSSVAGSLLPKTAMAVALHYPGAAGAAYAPVVSIGVSGVLAGANITVVAVPYEGGERSFVGAGRTDTVDLFLSDTASVLTANAAGNDLVMIASLQRSPPWRLMTLAGGEIKRLDQLQGTTIYIDGLPGDELPLVSSLKAAGVDVAKVKLLYPEIPAVGLDPSQLLDGTVAAMFVRSFDGYVRLAQYAKPDTSVSVGESYYLELPVAPLGAGLGIWASAANIVSDDAKIATAATLVALAQSMAQCRDDVPTCASLVAESSMSDLSVEVLAWGINALNGSLWPNEQGLFAIDRDALQSEIDAAVAAGLVANTSADSLINREIYGLADENWPANVDRTGANWTPLELLIP